MEKIDRDRFQERIMFRLFKLESRQIRNIVNNSRDSYGFRLYESTSHFIRCAVMKLVREELKKLKIKQGRPRVKK